MKSILTLVEDIYGIISSGDHVLSEENAKAFGEDLSRLISNRLFAKRAPRGLSMSMLGEPCDRKTWYEVNHPELAEPLPPQARMKFLFGDILEHLLLFLAKEAGHDVTGEQETLEISGVPGHRDAIIDGHLVDVKSASSMGFKKFKDHSLATNDPFNYLAQIGSYLHASQSDPKLVQKEAASFLAINKEMGHICLDTYRKADDVDYEALAEYKKGVVASKVRPDRAYRVEPDGKSGNMKLCTKCSYCSYKKDCWPTIRTFLYASGPRFLTDVQKLPDVPEQKEAASIEE